MRTLLFIAGCIAGVGMMVVAVTPAQAQAGAGGQSSVGSGPIAGLSSRRGCSISGYIPATSSGRGVRFDGVVEAFVDFQVAGGTQRVKVQFHWDRTGRGDAISVCRMRPGPDSLIFQADDDPPVALHLNGLPPGEPYVWRVVSTLSSSSPIAPRGTISVPDVDDADELVVPMHPLQ